MRNKNHRRRTAMALLFAFAIAFVGISASTAAAEQDTHPRPFHVTQRAEFETVGVCDFGAPLQVIVGNGHASHLGAFESYGEACLSHPTNVITWTAANGDTIVIEYFAEVGPIGPDGSASIALQGVATTGTGRFANMSFGDDTPLTGTIWFAPDGLSGHIEVSMVGTIIYDASDRSDR